MEENTYFRQNMSEKGRRYISLLQDRRIERKMSTKKPDNFTLVQKMQPKKLRLLFQSFGDKKKKKKGLYPKGLVL